MTDHQKIKDALDRASKTVTLRPERGQRVYRNVARISEGTVCHVEEASRTLVVDVGKALGGDDHGPNPSMILRTAMSTCVAIGIKQWGARADVSIDHVEVAVETDVDARGQLGVNDDITPGFEDVRLMIDITSSAPESKIAELVAQSLKYSPLIDVFAKPQTVRHETVVTSPGRVADHQEPA